MSTIFQHKSTRDEIIDQLELIDATLSLLGHSQPEVTRSLLAVIKNLSKKIDPLTEDDIKRITTDDYLDYKWAMAKSLVNK